MTAVGDRLRRDGPYGPSSVRSAEPLTPCPGDPERPAWLWDGHHCRLDKRLWFTYGFGCADYHRLLARQGGRCAVCGGLPRRWRLVVEHDHITGEVRGLAHFTCNRLLALQRPLLVLVWQISHYLTDPPGRALGLVVPAAKLRRLEAKDRAKRQRGQTRKAKADAPSADDYDAKTRRALKATKQGA